MPDSTKDDSKKKVVNAAWFARNKLDAKIEICNITKTKIVMSEIKIQQQEYISIPIQRCNNWIEEITKNQIS